MMPLRRHSYHPFLRIVLFLLRFALVFFVLCFQNVSHAKQKPLESTTPRANINHITSNHDYVVNPVERMKEVKDKLSHDMAVQSTQENIEMLLTTYIGNPTKRNNVTAVLHIGPHKTGSTTIQHFLKRKQVVESLYKRDHYARLKYNGKNMMDLNFATCFTDGNKEKEEIQNMDPPVRHLNKKCLHCAVHNNFPSSCDVNALKQSIEVALQNNNLILSAEKFAFNRESKLYHFLDMYYPNVYIIAYYRRFYSWIVSAHNQQYKHIIVPMRKSLVDYLSQDVITAYNNNYFHGVVRRYQQWYRNDQIRYYHLSHLDGPNLAEQFFCTAIPHHIKTCQYVRKLLKAEGVPHYNEHIEFIYIDLAYYASKMKLLSSEIIKQKNWLDKVADAAKYYQHNVLNITNSYDFGNAAAIQCPDQATLGLLWNLTIQSEKEFFPQYYNDSSVNDPNNEVLLDFKHYVDTNKFCHINATMILSNKNNTWWKFFTSLSRKKMSLYTP